MGKNRTGDVALQDYAGFSETISEQRTVSLVVLSCTKCAWHWRKTRQDLSGGCRNMAGGANVNSITWRTETLCWGDECQQGHDKWRGIIQNRRGTSCRVNEGVTFASDKRPTKCWGSRKSTTKYAEMYGEFDYMKRCAERIRNSQKCWPRFHEAGWKMDWGEKKKMFCKK